MNANELITSGIIELYCLGIASPEEQSLVEELAKADASVSEEIELVNETLANYAVALTSVNPPKRLKDKILSSIHISAQNNLPPELNAKSDINEWFNYLKLQDINEPDQYDGISMVELPGSDDYYSYAVYAQKGDVVPEEMHPTHNEFLLICRGECEMTIGGKLTKYKTGDFIAIRPGIPHSGLVTGDEKMIAIGQRRAA